MLIMVDAAHISAVIHRQQHNNKMMRLVLRGNRNRAATIFLRKNVSLQLPFELIIRLSVVRFEKDQACRHLYYFLEDKILLMCDKIFSALNWE